MTTTTANCSPEKSISEAIHNLRRDFTLLRHSEIPLVNPYTCGCEGCSGDRLAIYDLISAVWREKETIGRKQKMAAIARIRLRDLRNEAEPPIPGDAIGDSLLVDQLMVASARD